MPITKELIVDILTEYTDKDIKLEFDIHSLLTNEIEIWLTLGESYDDISTKDYLKLKEDIELSGNRFSEIELYNCSIVDAWDNTIRISFINRLLPQAPKVLIQCKGLTKTGKRCTRHSESVYCFQHTKLS